MTQQNGSASAAREVAMPLPPRVIPGALLLVDLSAVFWWKWHAAAGEHVDAAYEYTIGKVTALADDYERVAICCDSGRSFRYDISPDYKANRPPRDQAAIAQIKRVQRELAARGFPVWSVPNFEADDLIATAVARAGQHDPPLQVVIAASDKDLHQLVGDGVWMLTLTTDIMLDAAGIKAKLGVEPSQVADYLALVGDASDNVRGVPKVGPKTAARLLQEFGSAHGIYSSLHEVGADGKPLVQPDSIRASLAASRETLHLARELVALRVDCPIPFEEIDAPRVARPPPPEPPTDSEDAPLGHYDNDDEPASGAGAPPDANDNPTTPTSETMSTNGTSPAATTTAALTTRFSAAAVTTAPDASAHRFILTGRSGAGKTFFASTIPGVFILPIEEGLKGVSPDHNPAHFKVTPRNMRELHEALDVFAREVNVAPDGKRPFKHLVLDSLTGIESLVHAEACGHERVAHMEAKEYKKVWHAAEPEWDRLLQRLDAIRRAGTHVWMIAHSSEIIDASSTTGEVYRKWDLSLKGSGDVGAAMRNKVRGWADHVFFIDWVVKVNAGGKAKRSVGRYEGRILYTRESATHYAKTRSPLPASLPATWQDLAAALASGRVAPEPKLRAQIEEVAAQLPTEDRAAVLSDLASAPSSRLAAILSRAQGMLAVAREDVAEIDADVADAPIEAS